MGGVIHARTVPRPCPSKGGRDRLCTASAIQTIIAGCVWPGNTEKRPEWCALESMQTLLIHKCHTPCPGIVQEYWQNTSGEFKFVSGQYFRVSIVTKRSEGRYDKFLPTCHIFYITGKRAGRYGLPPGFFNSVSISG